MKVKGWVESCTEGSRCEFVFEIDDSKFKGWNDDEIHDYIENSMRNRMFKKIIWSWKIEA